jgi:predicted metalloprotease with PDZ domain
MDHLETDEDLLWQLGTESGVDWVKAGLGPLANLGIRGEDAMPGARLTAVAAGSPAQRAGLRRGDRILAMNRVPVSSYGNLIKRLSEVKPREEVSFQVQRDLQVKDLSVRLDDRSRVFTPVDAARVADLLPPRTTVQITRTDRALWHEWGTLVFFLVLVTVEWVGRKWAGLP